ncbi:MAG UNVERIFIED_CONTAM: hypothetical protein LVT10_03365 [Anaerolineae bacterium]
MVTQPQVLLLDEPLSNLDAKLRASARDELKDFQREFNITTIFVTHDQIEAMGLGDRIVVDVIRQNTTSGHANRNLQRTIQYVCSSLSWITQHEYRGER